MKKLLIILMMVAGFHGISLADHHANAQDAKDTEGITKAEASEYITKNKSKSTS